MGEALAVHDFVAGPISVDRLNPEWLRAALYTNPPRQLEYFAGIFPFGSTCNLGIRRTVIDRVGGFDETFLTGQDLELCLRLWAAGVKL
jgi:GT2 family glycosyltransferase